MSANLLLLLISATFLTAVTSQNSSPCPKIFSYEPRGTEEDRWYGVISLQTTEDLEGLWLKIILDKPAELLGNWLGEAQSSDNTEYIIKNPKYRLEAGPPVSIRFFVKYNSVDPIPSLKTIRLNGKTICSSSQDASTSTTPGLYISQIKPTARPPSIVNNFGESSGNGHRKPSGSSSNNFEDTDERPSRPSNNRPSASSNQGRPSSSGSSNSDRRPASSGTSLSAEDNLHHGSDFFPGDFALSRPQSQTQRPGRPTTFKREIACGTVASKASPLISYGQSTKQGQWPWHAALFHTQSGQFMYTCGGTLISDSHILTAAHCVAKPQTNKPVALEKLAVYLGKYSLKKFENPVQSREIIDIHIHPRYNHSFFFNDIAIIKLDRPVDFDNYVRPCCLWDDDSSNSNIDNQLGTVVGWGFDENRQISDSLMQAQMPVVPTTTCIFSNREFFSQFMNEQTYCAGFRNGTTVCNGDSGGGMVFPRPGSSKDNPVWQIRGIVSVGVALQGQGVCDPSHYIVFTDVSKHLQWIQRTIQN